jgi:hypothetical protein
LAAPARFAPNLALISGGNGITGILVETMGTEVIKAKAHIAIRSWPNRS